MSAEDIGTPTPREEISTPAVQRSVDTLRTQGERI